jgi:trans-aconitate 2-methyltransferase
MDIEMLTAPQGDWDPGLYMKFADERTRAAGDLLARVALDRPRLVYDLGCGPGNSSELLARRYPGAEVIGVDTSEAMLAHARIRAPQARFVQQDIAAWSPNAPPDLIFANAALQFVAEHDHLFPRLMRALAPGGVLAVQMPQTASESSHALMRMVAAEGPWSSRLVPVAKTRPLIAAPEDYYEWLTPFAARVDLWMTTYVHAFTGPSGIADWFAGSALQPFLERLEDDERCAFLARYREGLAEAYPAQSDGKVLMPYPRLFVVAQKG